LTSLNDIDKIFEDPYEEKVENNLEKYEKEIE